MASTRNSTKTAGRSYKVTKPAKKQRRSAPTRTAADRLLRELEIDGTATLGGKQRAPTKTGKVYKSGGGSWADLDQ